MLLRMKIKVVVKLQRHRSADKDFIMQLWNHTIVFKVQFAFESYHDLCMKHDVKYFAVDCCELNILLKSCESLKNCCHHYKKLYQGV